MVGVTQSVQRRVRRLPQVLTCSSRWIAVLFVFHFVSPISGSELILLCRGGEGRSEAPIARGEYTVADPAPQFDCDVRQLVLASTVFQMRFAKARQCYA